MKGIALYLRLSIEDGDGKEESNSISNQRKQLQNYIQCNPSLCQYPVKEFYDDGYSGTSLERPGLQALLKEVKENQIEGILVKDISRFSRDYIEAGTYLNQIFPFMGVWFVAVNDHYDSRTHMGTTIEMDTAFQTLLYDLYSKDISVKVKTAFQNKCENGEYVFGQVPFGYEKSKDRKNQVVRKEEEAKIVRCIFTQALEGKTTTQIAAQLNQEQIPTIRQMRYPEQEEKEERIQAWGSQTIHYMLNNRFYLGEMAYGKTVRKSVGSKGGIAIPKEEWNVIPDHHEPLVSQEEFEAVSQKVPGHSTKRKKPKHPLVGKLFCGGCRYSMSYKPIQKKNKYRRFECRKHAQLQIPDCCTYFSAELLEELVLTRLNKELLLRADLEKQQKNWKSYQKGRKEHIKQALVKCTEKRKQGELTRDSLYERYVRGEMEVEEYRQETDQWKDTLAAIAMEQEKLQMELFSLEEGEQACEKDRKQLLWYAQLNQLTQETVDCFIKRIYVYRDKRVEIEWDFKERLE